MGAGPLSRRPEWPRPGELVNYHPDGGMPERLRLEVRTPPIRLRSGVWVVWVKDLHGPIPIEHLKPSVT